MSVQAAEGDTPETIHDARLAACEEFAERFISPLA